MDPSKHQHVREIAALLCIALSAGAGAATGPRLSVFPKKIDFGVQPRGRTFEGAFELKNVGDQPLEIKEVETNCGCVASTYDKVVIQPGELFEFGFSLNTTELGDAIIKLKLNDPTQPQVILPIHISVLQEVEMEEQTLAFGRVPQGRVGVATVTAWAAKASKPVRVRSVSTTLDRVKLQARERLEESRVGFQVIGTLDTRGMPTGPFFGEMSAVLDLPKQPVVKWDVSGEVISGLVFTPNPLSLSALKDRLPLAHPRMVTLRSTGGQPFRILRVKCDKPYVKATVDNPAAAAAHRLAVDLAADTPVTPGAEKVRMEVFTDTRREPHVATLYVTVRAGDAAPPNSSGRGSRIAIYVCAGVGVLVAAAALCFMRKRASSPN